MLEPLLNKLKFATKRTKDEIPECSQQIFTQQIVQKLIWKLYGDKKMTFDIVEKYF